VDLLKPRDFNISFASWPLSVRFGAFNGVMAIEKMEEEMKNIRGLSFVLCSLLAMTIFNYSAQGQNEHAADDSAIRANVQQMEDGWNTKSGALFAKPFAEDADYVVINGQYLKGRAILDTAHQQIFDTVYKDTTIKLTIKSIRYLRPDVAVVHVDGLRNGPKPELKTQVLVTLVMTRYTGGWSIASFQNTQVQPQR
jgi:uncharacterized protein (TIGR02246 family)